MKQPDNQRLQLAGLLYLREKIIVHILQDNPGVVFWNPKTTKILSRKILEKTGHQFSDRALRMTVTEPVTNETKIPYLTKEKSRVDAVCQVLGYKGFRDFMLREQNAIQDLRIHQERKQIQTIRMAKPKDLDFYTIASGQTTLSADDKSFPDTNLLFNYAVCHYLTDTNVVFTAYCEFENENSTITLETYLIPFSDNWEANPHSIQYTGTFLRHQNGYIDLQVRHHADPSLFLNAVFFTNTREFAYPFAFGTYISRSMVTTGCYAGKTIIVFFKEKTEALLAYRSKPQKDIGLLLENSLMETPPMAFYTLDAMKAYKPGEYLAELPPIS